MRRSAHGEKSMRTIAVIGAIAVAGALLAAPAQAQSVSPVEVRAIAKDAVIWGFPLVDSYQIGRAHV